MLRATFAQAWRDCVPGSIGPGGCNSMAGQEEVFQLAPGWSFNRPGGGLSIAREAVNLLVQAVANRLDQAVAKR